MIAWLSYLLLAVCAAAAVWPAERGEKPWRALVVGVQLLIFAGAFALALARLQGGRLTGDFFAPGSWGRATPLLVAIWIAGLELAYGWLGRARLPLAGLTLIGLAPIAVLAAARGNLPALAFAAALGGLIAVAARRRPADAGSSRHPATWHGLGFLLAGAAVIAESGPVLHVPFSAWWVAFVLPLLEAVSAAVFRVWRTAGGESSGADPTYYQRLGLSHPDARRPATRRLLLYWGIAGGAAALTLAHYGAGRPGVHGMALSLAAAAVALDLTANRAARRAPSEASETVSRIGGAGCAAPIWVVSALLLFAFLTRAPNLLHQGFLTWDESRYAVIARDFLSSGDLGWTGARPMYILLLGWAYAAWGARDSIGGYVSLLFGVLSIALTYAWACRAFGRRAGIAAAVVLTASTLQAWFSRYQNSLTVVTAFLALAGWAYARAGVERRQPWRALTIAGASLGIAWMSHYAVGLAVPFWLALAGFGPARETWRRRARRAAAFGAGLAAAVGVWVALMPPGQGALSNRLFHSGFPIGCCLLDDLRNHLLPAGAGGTVGALLPPRLFQGDAGYYWRAILAFEGWAGLGLIAASLGWTVVLAWRRRDTMALHALVTSLGPLAVLSATAAAELDARARTLAIVLPSLAVVAGLTLRDWTGYVEGRLPAAAFRVLCSAGTAAVLLASAAWGAPLQSMTTPYDDVRRWLVEHGADGLVVFNPYGHDNGFAWTFYFGDRARFADTEADAIRACSEGRLDYMISAGEPLIVLGELPVVARFANPIYSTIPRLYDQQSHSTYRGQGLVGPPQAFELLVHDMRGCALE